MLYSILKLFEFLVERLILLHLNFLLCLKKNPTKPVLCCVFLTVVKIACRIRYSNTRVGRVLLVVVALSSSPTRRRSFVAQAPGLEKTEFSACAVCSRAMFRVVSLVNCVLFTHIMKREGTHF